MDLNAYFLEIATSHTDLAHCQTTKAYFREFTSARILFDSDFHKNLRFAANNLLISQFNNDSALPVPGNDFKRQHPTGSLYILSRIINNDTESARQKTSEICNDILSKIDYDTRHGILPKDFMVKNYQVHTIGRMADNFFGIVLFIGYSENYSAPYNASKWT